MTKEIFLDMKKPMIIFKHFLMFCLFVPVLIVANACATLPNVTEMIDETAVTVSASLFL